MLRSHASRRPAALAGVAALALFLGVASCSKDETPATPATTTPGTNGTTPGSTPGTMDPDELLAEAKTIAVGFFEAQAVNDWDKAKERASGAALLSVDWAQNVNTIAAANSTGYQVPSVQAPNVRVQMDSLVRDGDNWVGVGFVELSFRPGPVASTTTTAPPPGSTAPPRSPSTYAVGLTYTGDGDNLKLDDYRLDDNPYPVSQLFVSYDVTSKDGDLEGTTFLGHRDLDGSVQYLVDVSNFGTSPAKPDEASFFPELDGSTKPTSEVPAQLFADPAEAQAKARMLAVLPGAFPGTAGVLRVAYPAGGGTIPARTLSFTLPDWPVLTPRPTFTVPTTTPGESTTSSSSSTSSSTTSSVPGASTTTRSTPSTSGATTTSRPASSTTASTATTSTSSTSTSSSTTTTTAP